MPGILPTKSENESMLRPGLLGSLDVEKCLSLVEAHKVRASIGMKGAQGAQSGAQRVKFENSL